jgi:hypothetical protein
MPNVRVYDQLRESGHFCSELQLLLLVGQGQPYSLETKLFMLAQAHTAIDYTRCWLQYFIQNQLFLLPILNLNQLVSFRIA